MPIEALNIDIQYWIGTFLSNNAEITAAALFLIIAAFTVRVADDAMEAMLAMLLAGSVGYGLAGWNVILEWHYWAIPAVLFIAFGLYELQKKAPIQRILS